ncbi:hypothetical protein I6F50_05080 [Pseudoalteromonas sp. NZS127_1]|nr:hypothetical protein [Pseudoalteromonas sp. NZS127_1]
MRFNMKLNFSTTAYEMFWEDQNQKLLSHPCFIKEKGTIFDDVFYFKHHNINNVTEINFSLFDMPHINSSGSATLKIGGDVYPLSAKEYAKLFFIATIPKNNVYGITSILQIVIHIFAFLNFHKALYLSSNKLEDFWISYLSESVNENGFYNRLSPPSFSAAIKFIPLAITRNKLKALGVIGVIDNNITQKKVEIILDNVCQSQLGITLSEYRLGGSFNFLGLELGQYFIDYLRLVYQKDYLYMVICKKTIKKVAETYNRVLDSKLHVRINDVVVASLTHHKLDPHKKHTKGINHKDLFNEVQEIAFSEYQKLFESAMSLNEKCIKELVIKLGLGMRFDGVEIIRILMLAKFYDLGVHKSPTEIWDSYLASLDKTFIESHKLAEVTIECVYEQMQGIILPKKLKKAEFLRTLECFGDKILKKGLRPDYRSFKATLNNIVHAMTTLVAAWLGYRKSEFGFPLNAIQIEPNIDILDSSHIPFRFKLSWLVPKTHGKTKIKREITSQCYQIAAQLSNLFSASGGTPCLYECGAGKKVTNQSEMFIERRVKANWQDFVHSYQPFNDALKLELLNSKNVGSMNSDELKDFDRLRHMYDPRSARYKHLLSTAKEVKRDWTRLSCTSFSSARAQKDFKASIKSFISVGFTHNELHQKLIETNFSEKTKKLLRSGTVVLDNKAMNDIVNELLVGVRYPSSHALRHIWAEAVLTRYHGDIGAVIQHQFCHLDSSFFMAYLRNKDVRGLMKGASQRYLNSIVDSLLIDSDKVGQEYIGGFAHYVKKAVALTKPVSVDEFNTLRSSINERIISIQPSIFAICIPRDSGEIRAKCAKFGSINPQDAKPEFCLNCTNAVITSGNLRGIWTTIQPMVKEALNENTLGFMLESHLPTLRSGYKRIKQLQSSNSEAVAKILGAIETAIRTIELKLQQESTIYGK